MYYFIHIERRFNSLQVEPQMVVQQKSGLVQFDWKVFWSNFWTKVAFVTYFLAITLRLSTFQFIINFFNGFLLRKKISTLLPVCVALILLQHIKISHKFPSPNVSFSSFYSLYSLMIPKISTGISIITTSVICHMMYSVRTRTCRICE